MIEKSFLLVRTNPALTGNVKLVVSSDYKLYLESFDTNKSLSQDRFRHFEIKKEEYYKEVIPHFFKDVESNAIFEIKNNNDASEMHTDYRSQFDDRYFCGAFFTEDAWHKEENEYFAPLYLKPNHIPKNFIILRVDGSGSLNEDSSAGNFRTSIVDKWKFVSMFDLTPKSDLGLWLHRNFVEDEGMPKHPLYVKHGETELSEVSGIDIKYGGWATRYMNLHEFQTNNTPIFKTEEYVTKLWENQNVLYPHILNLKFLFNDTPATHNSLRTYSQNRYAGFYLDDTVNVKTVSPYEGIELNKASSLKDLLHEQVSEIPYLKDNMFVREVNGRLYAFDPIKKGWSDNQTYWVEWESEFYRIERVANTDDLSTPDAILGDYLYRIVSKRNIECTLVIKHNRGIATIERWVNGQVVDVCDNVPAPKGRIDEQIIKQMKKVLINDLSTGKDKIAIKQLTINNNITYNILENVNTQHEVLTRVQYDWVDGKFLFRLDVNTDVNNNLFTIPNFEEADLHLMKIGEDYHVIKQYPLNTPNVGGKYYIHSDWAMDVNDKNITAWINNGNVTKNSAYYKNTNIESVTYDSTPPYFEILRVNFTEINDFDFDRVDTDYAKYEYEKKNELTPSLHVEPKLYAKEHRDLSIKIRTLAADKVRRIPILDINNRPYKLREGEINTFTGKPYTAEELYRTEFDGAWSLFDGEADGQTWQGYRDKIISVNREFYREEEYIWRIEDNSQTFELDFKSNADAIDITQEVKWVDEKTGLESPNGEIGLKQSLKPIKAKTDPNQIFDPNYIPVSSEYIASDELWEIRNNDLTDIWRKNQSICKWGFMNSIGLHDYPYRLNYSLDMAGTFNREPNPFAAQETPVRKHFDLEYFYRFGLADATDYDFYSLHLKNAGFDQFYGFNVDRYMSAEFDYFEYILKSDQEVSNGLLLNRKYSSFITDNEFGVPYTLFRGIKYSLFDVHNISKEVDAADENNIIIDDIETKTNAGYEDYKFSVVFGKKSSSFSFNAGTGSSNGGIDIYMNDVWKNVVIHLYIDTDETIQINDKDSNQVYNAETCPIDLWYQDAITLKEMDVTAWDRSEFKISGLGMGLRPRDFMLSRFLFVLNNYNYIPSDNKNPINFIHIYNDGREPKIMSYENTDFILKTELPTEFLVREKAYKTVPVNVSNSLLSINNTLKNRIVLNDVANGTSGFTSDGVKVGTLSDLNTYNNYPVARQIIKASDLRPYWQLSEIGDPSFYRYSGVYTPIFKRIPLFRPMAYNALAKQGKTPVLPAGNWKFYDPSSSADKPKLVQFATMNELVFSKCNPSSNVLKIQDENGTEKSIYPMVDEYGYDYDSRYLFASTWEPNYHYLSRRVEVEPNEYAGFAGYALVYNGVKDFLRIPDNTKFNLERFLVEDTNYSNFIMNEPEGERSFFRKTLLNVSSDTRTFDMKLLVDQDYKLSLSFHNYNGTGDDKLKYSIAIINDPSDVTQTSQVVLLDHLLEVIPNASPAHTFNTNVTKAYKYGNIVNVRVSFQVIGTAKVDIYPMSLELVNNTKNFLDLSLYNVSSEDAGIPFVNDIGIWGGYLRKNGLTPEVGDVSDFPFKITPKHRYLSYNNLVSNLNIELGSRGFSVASAVANWNNSPIIRITHDEPFSFEPERWTNIEDGRSIVYVGEKYGDSTITPSHKLKWFTSYKPQSKKIITKKIFKFENEQGRMAIEPKPLRIKSMFIPGRLRQKPVADNYMPFDNGIQQDYDVIRGSYNNTTIHDVVEYYNAPKKLESPTKSLPKFLQPFGKITFVPMKKFLPVPLPAPQTRSEEVVSYTDSMAQQLPESIVFDIIPDNGHPISVSVSSMHPEDGSALPVQDVVGLINNIITPEYIASEVTGEQGTNYKTVEIKSAYSGSYYNFQIQESSSHIEIVSSTLASEEVTVSEKFTKTSLKDDVLRTTGYLSDYTVEFYVRIGSWSKEYETIFYKGLDGNDPWLNEAFNDFTMVIGRDKNTNTLAFRTCHKGMKVNNVVSYEKHTLLSNADIADGQWHHVAFVVDAVKKRKSIIIDKRIDATCTDFLTPETDEISQREMIARFLDNKDRFFVGADSIPAFNTLAATIRSGGSDFDYWYDVIRGYGELKYWDKHSQILYVGTTVDLAYKAFQENYESLKYYLNTSRDNTWHILLATDNSQSGRRNFNGGLDELRIWNYARSNDQVANNANFILRPESYLDPLKSLVAYYRFDDGKGSDTVKDLMGGKMVSDIVKWCKVKTQFIYDGNNEVEKDEVSFYLFDSAFHAGADAQVMVAEQQWTVSGAHIIGYSDERYVAQAPPVSTKELTEQVEKPIFPKSKYVLEKAKAPTMNVEEHIVKATKKPLFETFRTSIWKSKIPVKTTSKKSWFDRVVKPIIQPKKVVASVAKAPAKALATIKSLFKKRKK